MHENYEQSSVTLQSHDQSKVVRAKESNNFNVFWLIKIKEILLSNLRQ